MFKRVIYIIISLLYMAGICLVSLKSGSHGHGQNLMLEIFWNAAHIPVYGILAYLILQWFSAQSFFIYGIAFIFTLTFGIFNEYLQSLTRFRSVSFMDVTLNATGAALFLFFYWLIRQKLTQYSQPNTQY